ncbi:hypothetical protein vseg_013401 [Gypsophila vaccaria]
MSNYSVQVGTNREWKVLVVDSDRVCLTNLEKMLQTSNYHVTTCENAKEAMPLLQNQNNNFDIVMIDVCTGIEFVKHICEEIDLPVIAMSSDDDEEVIKDVFKAGVCDYLFKPLRLEIVRYIWMNVYRAQGHRLLKKAEQSWSNSATTIINDQSNKSGDYLKLNENSVAISDCDERKCLKKRKLINTNDNNNNNNNNKVGDNQQVNDDASTSRKKPRIIWTPELHDKFVAAVNQFGNSKAVPKKILEIMNVHGLTRENVASHLQKYRQYNKRPRQKKSHQQSGNKMNTSMPSQEQKYQAISPINGHNIKAQTISTSSLQVRSYPSQIDLYGSDQTLGEMTTHAMKTQAMSNESIIFGENRSTTDVNMAIVEHVGSIYHHPTTLASSYAYAKVDSKVQLVEATTPWSSTFGMEDNNVKREASSLFAREMGTTTTSSIGGQYCANYAYENLLDLGCYDGPFYDEQLDDNNNAHA